MENTHGFTLVFDRLIPELKTRARMYRHDQTGAELLSLENEDENKVFGINFRTPPPDSTGLPHIMEHAVLCGSRKYPVREPFVELAKGSLNTFLNAMTFPDKTCYPVASQNVQDFYNLVDVYMDAVLYPLIPPETLQQEGWHYELDQPGDPLSFKGVVFNEMKGNYSDPDTVLIMKSQMELFPDSAYGLDSGGDPAVIPDLTYTQFKRFHETYYHPSNALIYFYGDDNPEERLRRMDEYLGAFQQRPIEAQVTPQPAFPEPKTVTVPYEPGDESGSNKAYLTVNWLLAEGSNPEKNLALQILNHILTATPASPLRKALIDSGLGEDLAGVGLDPDLRQMYFSTGLKGIRQADAPQVEKLILDTLADLANAGIDPETVAASLNTVEFRLRENNTGRFPRGLALMLRSLSTWLYGWDPLALLAFEAPLNAIKEKVARGEKPFESLIRQHFLQNNHRVTVILEPHPGHNAEVEARERQRLEQARQGMDKAGLQAVVASTKALKRRQETPDSEEALATIPSLRLEDLDKQNKVIPIEVKEHAGTRLLYHDLFTNGIVYLDLGFNLHSLPADLLPFVPLLGRAFTEIGTETMDFVRLSQRIGQTTGGIRATVLTSAVQRDGQGPGVAWLFLRGKSTVGQTPDLLGILEDILLKLRLDNRERFKQIVLEEKASQEAGVIPAGHRVVNTRLRGMFTEADWAAEQMGGVSYLFFLRRLAEEVEKDWAGVLGKLENLRKALVSRSNMLFNLTLDAENYQKIAPRLGSFISGLPEAGISQQAWQRSPQPPNEALTIPAQVNFVGKAARLYDLGYQLDGSLLVVNKYLNLTWLWEKVRVQGGAYGGFGTFDHRSGVYAFLSYRDPNLVKTLENYDLTGQFLRRLELSQEELVKSIIGTIGELDDYLLPDARGYQSMARYLAGETDEFRQKIRDEVLSTTVEDFHAAGEVFERVKEAGKVVVLGSEATIQQANEAKGGLFEVKKVL